MNMRKVWSGLLTALGLASLSPAAGTNQPAPPMVREVPSPVFAGYAILANEPHFVLLDRAGNRCSPWLKLGQEWRGFTARAFDRGSEKLTLRSDNVDRVLALPEVKILTALALPGLVKGTYTLLDGSVLYSTDAQLKLGDGFVISSPTGVMVSDEKQSVVRGDLSIQLTSPDSKSTIEATEATVDFRGEHTVITGQHVRIRGLKLPAPEKPAAPNP